MQSEYGQLIQLLVLTLSKRLIKFYDNQACNESSFKSILIRITTSLKLLEKSLTIKVSDGVTSLLEILSDHPISNRQSEFERPIKQQHEPVKQIESLRLQDVQHQDLFTGLPPYPEYSKTPIRKELPQLTQIPADLITQIENNVTQQLAQRYILKKRTKTKQQHGDIRQLPFDLDQKQRTSQSSQKHRPKIHSFAF